MQRSTIHSRQYRQRRAGVPKDRASARFLTASATLARPRVRVTTGQLLPSRRRRPCLAGAAAVAAGLCSVHRLPLACGVVGSARADQAPADLVRPPLSASEKQADPPPAAHGCAPKVAPEAWPHRLGDHDRLEFLPSPAPAEGGYATAERRNRCVPRALDTATVAPSTCCVLPILLRHIPPGQGVASRLSVLNSARGKLRSASRRFEIARRRTSANAKAS